jgi:hypothetical protein
MEPREPIQHIGEDASRPLGSSERFAGYAVIGMPFHSRINHSVASRTCWPGVIAEKNTGTD